MMKLKVGNDIIETERIKRLYEKYADNFKNKVYTSKEIEYCESKKSNKFQSYAGRFAAKEAVFKAISQGFSNKYQINWKDIEILNDVSGRPYVNLNNINFVDGIDISISHIKDYAIATVIVVFK